MKKSMILSAFVISFLTFESIFCSSDDDDYKRTVKKAFSHFNASQQMNLAKENANYKNADKRRMQLLGKTSQATVKKAHAPIPGSAAYATIKNKK